MAGNNVRIGALRYDIIADSSLFSRGLKTASKMSRKLAKDVALTRTPLERYKKELLQARKALKANLIDERAYLHTKKRLRAQYVQENALINKHTHKLLLNTKAKNANAAASSRMNLANIGGAAASMFGGKGGAAVGRGIGIGAMAGGATGLALGVGFAGSAVVAKMLEEFGDLQEAATDLKVFLGEDFGEEAANAFRKIARESSLTTAGLIKNARVWASYGLETDNIVDIVERLGIAAGGEAAAFDNLTRAFAQVNAAGKLMGQEKNQLINAGFSLKLIADEAGVSMTNFAKAMEQGLITAEHVNNALIKATDEGGLYFGRLEKKAQTLNGKLDLVANNFNDLFANLGESKQGPISGVLDLLNETLSHTSNVISQANQLERTRQKARDLEKGSGIPDRDRVPGSSEPLGSRRREQDIRTQMNDQLVSDAIRNREGWSAVGSWVMGARSFLEIFESEDALRLKRAQEQQQANERLARAKAAAGPAAVQDDSDVAANTRAKRDQEELSFLEEKAKLQKQLASDEERQMMEMQEEYDKYAQLLRTMLELNPMAQQTLLQMKKDAMSADAERAIEEDKLDEEKRQGRRIEDALDTAGPGKMMQNSVEEYVYLKTQRDNAKQEAKQEKRYQEDRALKNKLNQELIFAVENLTVSQQPGMDNNTVAIP
ncbi:tape measure protein [bacterium]|nr:tape measure protein [bacterium]